MPGCACPSDVALEAFLLGLGTEQEATHHEQHLAECPACAARLHSLRAEDAIVATMRVSAAPIDSPYPDLMRSLIPLLKCLRSSDTTQTFLDPRTTQPCPFTFSFLAPPARAGDMGQLGKFRVLEPLGAGGMGLVFHGYDETLNRHLAIKVIKPELGNAPAVVERFLQEARAIAAVEHRNIVAIYEAEAQNGIPYLVMPLLKGESLEAYLHKVRGPLPLDEVLVVARDTARGLAAAHERGLVHRDIKPGNLWLEQADENTPRMPNEPAWCVKILDFGLAQTHGYHDEGVSGTPAYMAPEQVLGHPVDGRADLFSLGCVLYRVATGESPFTGTDTMGVMIRVATQQHCPVGEANPALPPDVVHLIEQLLAKRPEGRPPSAHEVILAVEAIQQRRRDAARPWLVRHGWIVAALLGLAIGLGLWAWHRSTTPVGPTLEPGEVTFDYTDADIPLQILSGERHWDLLPGQSQAQTFSLPPGDYAIRPTIESPRQLTTDRFTVKPAEAQTIRLALVGEIRHHQLHQGSVTAVTLAAPDNTLLACSVGLDRHVCLWHPREDQRDERFAPRFLNQRTEPTFPPLRALALTRRGDRAIFAGGDVTQATHTPVFVWEVEADRRVPRPIVGAEGVVTGLALAEDGEGKSLATGVAIAEESRKYLVATSTGIVSVWNLQTNKGFGGRYLPEPESRNLGIEGVAVSPTGTHALVACGDGSIRVLDLQLILYQQKIDNAHQGRVLAVAYLPEGQGFVSAGEDGVIRIWDARTRQARELRGHERAVRCLAVDTAGTRLLSGGADGTLRLWDLESGKELKRFAAHPRGVNGVALTGDGRQALSGGSDRFVRFWQLPN